MKPLALVITLLGVAFLGSPLWAKSSPASLKKSVVGQDIKGALLREFKRELSKKEIVSLRKRTLGYAGKSIPALIEVMKSSKYPDKNRWIATFLVGRIMGKKSGPFISKFLKHPNWIMRTASLKTLLALKQNRYGDLYAKALKDKSFIVRKQALDNIAKLSLKPYAAHVWAMLYDKRNYYTGKKGKKRTNLVKEAIKVVGDLRFEKAKKPLLSMIQKDKYKDIFIEMDYSLAKITGKKSPKGNLKLKRNYWKKIGLMEKTF